MIRVFLFYYLDEILNWEQYHQRTPDRITLWQILLQPFSKIWDEFAAWRTLSILRANVTNETICMEKFLNYIFNAGGTDIYIETAGPGGVSLGMYSLGGAEAAAYESMGLEPLGGAEAAAYQSFPLPGEDLLTGTASFGVYVPSALSVYNDLIKGVVNNYRFAGKTFVIINY